MTAYDRWFERVIILHHVNVLHVNFKFCDAFGLGMCHHHVLYYIKTKCKETYKARDSDINLRSRDAQCHAYHNLCILFFYAFLNSKSLYALAFFFNACHAR